MKDKRYVRTLATIGVTLGLALVLILPALADGPDAVAWLKAQQNADGGFGTPASAVGATADVLIAAAASGENGLGWAQAGGDTTLVYLLCPLVAIE